MKNVMVGRFGGFMKEGKRTARSWTTTLQDDVSAAGCQTFRDAASFVRDEGKVAKGGFTLIELLVVVLIIGILAAVALPQYEKAVLKSRVAGAFAKLEALDKAQTIYYMSNGRYTTDLEKLDLDLPDVTCSGGETIYCQECGKRAQKRVLLEFQGKHAGGTKNWICMAKKGDEVAQSICQGYYKEWQGTRAPYEHNNGYIYYKSADR